MKKTLMFVFATITIFILIFFVFCFLSGIKKTNNRNLIPFPTSIQLSPLPPKVQDRINISGVEVKDFTKNPGRIDSQKDVFITEGEEYRISYLAPFNHFKITIIKSPFEEIRQKAEQDFLKRLEITKEEACRLNVSESTPSFVDPSLAGKSFPLSFCSPN